MPEGGIFEVLRSISYRGIPDDFGVPSIANADPVPFSVENFHPISSRRARLCFVDGGNNSIFVAPGQAIHMVRLYYSVFQGDEKIKFGRFTYILDTRYDPGSGEYVVRVHDVDNAGILPEEMTVEESALREEKIRAIGTHVRRLGEWLLMEKIAGECNYIVRDGSLQTGEAEEYMYQERVFNRAKGIIGISKTCSLMTTRGFSIVAAVQYLAERNGIKAPWYYNPIARNISTIRGDMFVIKLHPMSEYAFRAEIYPETRAEEILAALVPQSNDATFIGYPYGLLDADINARISDEEVKLYRSMISDFLDDFSRMEMRALDAHDRISEVK